MKIHNKFEFVPKISFVYLLKKKIIKNRFMIDLLRERKPMFWERTSRRKIFTRKNISFPLHVLKSVAVIISSRQQILIKGIETESHQNFEPKTLHEVMMMMKSFPIFCSLNFLSEETFGQTLEFRNQKLKKLFILLFTKEFIEMKFDAHSLLKMNFLAKV